MTESLSTRLAAARRAQGLTQQQIANALGVSRAAVGQWESGTTEPSVRNLKALNDLLSFDLSGLDTTGTDTPAKKMSAWRYLFRRELNRDKNIDLPIDMVCVGSKAECLPITGSETQVIDYVPRPTALDGDDAAFALLIATDALYPRFEQEEVVYISTREQPAEGEYGVVLIVDSSPKARVYLGRIVEFTDKQITMETFKPAARTTFSSSWVVKVFRVVPWNELLNQRDDMPLK